MTKEQFRTLFARALRRAAVQEEERIGRPVPRIFEFELPPGDEPRMLLSFDEVLDRLYLGTDRMYRIVDISIKELRPLSSIVFVRPSGHSPSSLEDTWAPNDLGPFKILVATPVKIIDQ
jgi:hypothetical protein